MGAFNSYLGYVKITDGQHSIDLSGVAEIYIKERNGRKTKIKIGSQETRSQYYGGNKRIGVIKGHKTTKGRGLVEELTYGKRHYIKNLLNIPFKKGTWTGKDGILWRRAIIGKDKGICHTDYRSGKFKSQWFNYSNGVKAYHFTRKDTELNVKYPNGKLRSEYKGSRLIYDSYKAQEGLPCIEPQNSGYNGSNDYELIEYNKRGEIVNQVTTKDRQLSGKIIKNGIPYFYVNGLAVPEKLYNAKPDELDPRQVLRQSNAQVRAMLLKKVGLERVVKECNGKLIDADKKTGNELYDFKVKYTLEGKFKGSGVHEELDEDDKAIRILKVVCPSTKNNYFLRIPVDEDFATCESARQGTFTGWEKGKVIKWNIET